MQFQYLLSFCGRDVFASQWDSSPFRFALFWTLPWSALFNQLRQRKSSDFIFMLMCGNEECRALRMNRVSNPCASAGDLRFVTCWR